MKTWKYKAVDASRNLEILMESQAVKNRDEELARQIQVLKQKLEEVGQLARGRGLGVFFHFRHGHATEDGNGKPTWSLQKPSRKISSPEELTSLIYSLS
ncbi:hypothetical protein NC651_040328 [Populus alba x Populus x berolinensis]|nr:hypothetical protein NC651_040328 [Populus alba x Populus x berolinensis]